MPELTDLFTSDAKRIAALEKLVQQQAEALEKARRPRAKLTPSSSARSKSGDFIRVVIPDTHGSKLDETAAKAFLADLSVLKPSQIVMLGDHIDCGGFLAQHHTLGYVAETTESFEEDVSAANTFLDAVQSACSAKIHYIEGNHERRIEKWCVTQALKNGNPRDAEFLGRMFSTENVLSLKTRGIEFYKQGRCYFGLRIPSTIKLGHCYFTHGSRVGVNAAKMTLNDFGSNVVFGHTHRIQQHQSAMVDRGGISAWSVGCLCRLQPYYMHTQITGHSHGYGLQFCRANGDFLHVTVPIVDGRSLLVPLTKLVA